MQDTPGPIVREEYQNRNFGEGRPSEDLEGPTKTQAIQQEGDSSWIVRCDLNEQMKRKGRDVKI